MNDDPDPEMKALREELERHFASGTPMEVIYFGGELPGAKRTVTPLRYCEERGRNYLIGLCHRSGIKKTFRLDRVHLPAPPLDDGQNDFGVVAKALGNTCMLEGMLSQIARLGNLPLEKALAAHLEQQGDFESFFDEYSYGGYTLELQITSTVIYLSLGYEADTCETMHYEFTSESEPRLTPGIATHYSLYTGCTVNRPRPEPALKSSRNEPSSKDPIFTEIEKVRSEPGPHVDYPMPETTAGVFLEHFDLSPPLGDGKDGIVYRWLYETAREAALVAGWTFRSYSIMETPGTRHDFIDRQIRHFPTLILYRDGVELGRHTYVMNTVPGIQSWGNKLLELSR